MIVAGLGCRKGCAADEIVALVRDALTRAKVPAERLKALATAAFKSDEAGLHEASAILARPLLLIDEAALRAAESGCVTRSEVALAATGFASVAESAALAAAGPGARLILPRIAAARATCALAEGIEAKGAGP